jgi:phosphoglycerate dehydrogenase-like enzyme
MSGRHDERQGMVSSRAPRVLVIGRQAGFSAPGLPEHESGASYVMADDMDTVRAHLPECDVVFHFGGLRDALRGNWPLAQRLRWVQVAGVGVDWTLFPELVASDVVLTNARGVFDTTLPEYLLALMLGLVKDLPGTVRSQGVHEWRHRLQEPLAGSRALVVGAGTIGRAAAAMLRSLSVEVTLVARSARDGDGAEGRIRAIDELDSLLPAADWLVLVTPLTPQTRGLIGAHELGLLPERARVVNIGRGPVLDETALVDALRSGAIRGAALDVFEHEPLPPQSPLWDMPNVIVSAHIGGDVAETMQRFTDGFLENLRRYIAGRPLRNVVDKQLGFVSSADG